VRRFLHAAGLSVMDQFSTSQDGHRKWEQTATMNKADYIALAGVLATLISVLVTWLVMKRQFASKKLSYALTIQPLLLKQDDGLARDLKVFYRGEELPQPTLLSVDIANIGLAAVEDAKVIIQLLGATYLIPGYFQDTPLGYGPLWTIERSDAEKCEVHFKHINPKQIARIRLLMDEVPQGEPLVFSPMPNVELTKASRVELSKVAEIVIGAVSPKALNLIKQLAGFTPPM
jgi:hypothetical protein